MANFNLYIPKLLSEEGGYNPNDMGQPGNKGILLSTFKASAYLLGISSPTLQDLKNMTASQAGVIYKHQYWDALRCDEYNSQELAEIFCDCYVNSGAWAIKMMQVILGVDIDGGYGNQTHAALMSFDATQIYNQYRYIRETWYRYLGNDLKSGSEYDLFHSWGVGQGNASSLNGWLERLKSFPYLDVAVANAGKIGGLLFATIGMVFIYRIYKAKHP